MGNTLSSPENPGSLNHGNKTALMDFLKDFYLNKYVFLGKLKYPGTPFHPDNNPYIDKDGFPFSNFMKKKACCIAKGRHDTKISLPAVKVDSAGKPVSSDPSNNIFPYRLDWNSFIDPSDATCTFMESGASQLYKNNTNTDPTNWSKSDTCDNFYNNYCNQVFTLRDKNKITTAKYVGPYTSNPITGKIFDLNTPSNPFMECNCLNSPIKRGAMVPRFNSIDWRDTQSNDDSCRMGVKTNFDAYVPTKDMADVDCRNTFFVGGNIVAAGGSNISSSQTGNCGGAPAGGGGAPAGGGGSSTNGGGSSKNGGGSSTNGGGSSTSGGGSSTSGGGSSKSGGGASANAFMTFLKDEKIKGVPNKYLLIGAGVIFMLILLMLFM